MLVSVDFRSSNYGENVARILALDGDGTRAMPLAAARCSSEAARTELKKWNARELFPASRSPEGALAGLFLYFSCFEEAHAIAQDLNTAEGSFWHGILHRQEPDAFNAGYWFRQVGRHPVYPALGEAARQAGYDAGAPWDPRAFIDFCESARKRPGSDEEDRAMRVQLAEWQLLFNYCASGAGEKKR